MLLRPNRLGFVGDVIVGRLCGRRAHDPTSLGIAMLYNPWLGRPDPEILARLGLDECQLPDLIPADTPAGGLLAEVAALVGLRPGIPVSPAVHDQYAAALGAGAVAAGDMNFGAGTAWVLLANTDRVMRPVVDQAFVCRHLVPGLYGQMLSLGNGGSAIQWVMNLLGREQCKSGRDRRPASSRPPAAAPGCGSGRCLLAMAGTDPPFQAGGRLDRITLAHQPSHLVARSWKGWPANWPGACDGSARRGWPSARRFSMCGVAAASRVTPQIVADVTNLPVACVDVPDVSAFGAAMLACALVDPRGGLADVARQWSSASRVVHPGPNAAALRRIVGRVPRAVCASGRRDRRPVRRWGPKRPPSGRGGHHVLVVGVRASRPRSSPGGRGGPAGALHHVWHYTQVDRDFWKEHLAEWLPRRIFDAAHPHLRARVPPPEADGGETTPVLGQRGLRADRGRRTTSDVFRPCFPAGNCLACVSAFPTWTTILKPAMRDSRPSASRGAGIAWQS